MSEPQAYHLFDVTGIELEYMVVDRDSLQVQPIVDQLFETVTGRVTSDVDRGDIEWSNELVAHVVELKTAEPVSDLQACAVRFRAEIRAINGILSSLNAMLLPTAAHPLMDPFTQTTLWAHDYSEIYALYNRIFDCRGHGWSNLQSMHLNLPFVGDDEFGQLHSAIRVLLPLVPALAASSPLLDGQATGWLDSRMESYLHHQERLPALMGPFIPERVFDQTGYTREVFEPIQRALAPFDVDGVMNQHFANSRGAIARFDRGAVEIRVIDVQECPSMDLAIAELVVATTRALVEGHWADPLESRSLVEGELLDVFRQVIQMGRDTEIRHAGLLSALGLDRTPRTTGDVWRVLIERLHSELSPSAARGVALLLEQGSLAERILWRTGSAPSRDKIVDVYRELAACLHDDRPFARG